MRDGHPKASSSKEVQAPLMIKKEIKINNALKWGKKKFFLETGHVLYMKLSRLSPKDPSKLRPYKVNR